MTQEPQIEFEICADCKGEGQTLWFNHSGPRPVAYARLCETCYGMKKRPKQQVVVPTPLMTEHYTEMSPVTPFPPPMPVDLPLPNVLPSIPISESSK